MIDYIPALYKIFDEILVNASDNRHRAATSKTSMKEIRVWVNENLEVTIMNDGPTIPIVMHPTEKMYVPGLNVVI